MKSTIRKEIADRFDRDVLSLIETEDPSCLEKVIKTGTALVANIVGYYGDLYFGTIFAKDMIVECLQKIIVEEKTISPTRVLRNITHGRIKTLIQNTEFVFPTMEDIPSYGFDVQSRLIFEETLEDLLFLLPLHVQSAILFLIFYPNKDRLFRSLYPTIDYFLILRGIGYLRQRLNLENESQEYFKFDLPDSQTARLLFISSLYKLSPGILVLLMQTKNLEIVLQFCKLFGGQSLHIPSITELSRTLSYASIISQKVEDGSRVGDQESLAYLATEISEIKNLDYTKLSLNPLLSSFIEKSLHVTLENYQLAQKRLVSSMDTTSPTDIIRVFDLINKEIFSQTSLLLQLTTSIEDYSGIQKILHILKHNNPKKSSQEHTQ